MLYNRPEGVRIQDGLGYLSVQPAAAAGGTIAFVQEIDYSGDNVSVVNPVINGVGSGNLLVAANAVFLGSGNPPNDAPTDDKTNTWNTTTAPSPQSQVNAFINYAMNVASGNTTLTVDYGDGFYITGSVLEFSGAATSGALDQETSDSQATDSTPTVGPTGTTTVASEAVIVCLAGSSTQNPYGIDTPATTSYTNAIVQQNNSTSQAGSVDYKVVSATGTQDAAWGTLDGSFGWVSKIATFEAA